MSGSDRFRLPRTVAPVRYELVLTPDLATGSFSGEERVRIRVIEPLAEIVLNAAELTVHSAGLSPAGGSGVQACAVALDEESERLTIIPPSTVAAGEWDLELSFSGTLNDKLRGFYRSTFRTDAGEERTIATTQFEPADARRAFPCWDEPDRKAVFSVALVTEEGMTAVSNGRLVSTEALPDGRRRMTFADTMPMSTYLVAFIVGPLEATDPVMVDGIPVRVIHRAGRAHLTAFALEAAAHALHFFATWFGIPYPSDKLDHIAIPDFAFGAMENLGAVTYRESVLLVDPATATRDEVERVAEVIAHETAHMWFGDLVTMKWWNGIWLNEAFATFMEMLCVDDFRPEWNRWLTFAVTRDGAMAMDSVSTTRAIEFPVTRPDEAEAMFDALTYQKGAGVLRMLERYLGADDFRRGIHRYLEAHAHANTETSDLWDALEAESGQPVRAIMDSWIFQGGHPLVSVDESGDGLRFSQERFVFLRPDAPAGDGSLWQVPMLLRTGSGAGTDVRRLLMAAPEQTAEVAAPVEWVVANGGGSGVFRTAYGDPLFRKLIDHLADLDPVERMTLLNDTWASVLAGVKPLSDYLTLASQLGGDDNPRLWELLHMAMRVIERLAAGDGASSVHGFVRRLAGPALDRLGWDSGPDEAEQTRLLRAELVTLMGTVGADPHTVERAGSLHRRLMEDREAVEPNLAAAVTSVVAHHGTLHEYEEYVGRWRRPATPQEEVRYLYALADFPDRDLMTATLALAGQEVRTQNAPFLIASALANAAAGDAAWRYVAEHWSDLLARFPDNTIARMLGGIVWMWSHGLTGEVDAFLDTHPFPPGERTIRQLRDRLHVYEAVARREQPTVRAALDAAVPR